MHWERKRAELENGWLVGWLVGCRCVPRAPLPFVAFFFPFLYLANSDGRDGMGGRGLGVEV